MKPTAHPRTRLATTLGLFLAAGAAQAAGPLYLSTETGDLKPLTWDTSQGPIPVYTDGGGAFTYDFDGVTPFITIERANEITAFAFNEWSQVSTSTFRAEIAGTIEEQTGIADVIGANATDMYSVENGYGFWVLYDTDGSILQEYFGVDRNSVLGIAFPEWSDGNGNIIEATALMNGWGVHVDDPEGTAFAGVFTHEFGHAINMSHSQVNGSMAYQSYTYAPEYPGVPGCVDPLHRYDYPTTVASANPIDVATLETMFPFIDSSGEGGREQSTVDRPDDRAGISNLYPTADYASSTGTITGVLRLKDGDTEFSGINIIARNVDDPLFDAVSAMSGDQTQGQLGPDGRFTIRNLTPGARYVVYIESITSGGYPTTPQRLVSQGEYWNAAESSDPTVDATCDATPILAEAGVTREADITFNGYMDGIQFTPIIDAHLVSLSRSGNRASGIAGTVPFVWDRRQGIELLPEGMTSTNAAMDSFGDRVLVQSDPDGNGINEPTLVSTVEWFGEGRFQQGGKPRGFSFAHAPMRKAAARRGFGAGLPWRRDDIEYLGDLNGDTCGGSSQSGTSSVSGWDVDALATRAVGLGYVDRDGNGSCQSSFTGEIVPVLWDAEGGMRELHTWFEQAPQFVRANTISGNGRVVLGTAGFQQAVAWVDEGAMINLGEIVGARDAYASNFMGTRIPLSTREGVLVWNALKGTGAEAFRNIDGLRWCRDIPYVRLGSDYCELLGEDEIYEQIGAVPLNISATSDDGRVIIARAGTYLTGGFQGAIWIEGLGWMLMKDFLHKQGVVEASDIPFDNPIALSGTGQEIAGGIAGVSSSWLVDMEKVYVCRNGRSIETNFPTGLQIMTALGAEFGRCEFLD